MAYAKVLFKSSFQSGDFQVHVSTDRMARMAARQYNVEDVLAYMEIPLPEEDDDDFSKD